MGNRSKALEICKSLQDKGVVTENKVSNNMGVIYKREGQMEKALECFKQSISQVDDSDSEYNVFFATYNLGVTHAQLK